ncbi:MAG: indole-3-glycerol phosphate synthase TrpC [Alphaproteobacteria bacterium]|nr:indole-3-glycerol phosphate synthase TrpC [Alphaproteobacteria bacterium]USO07759.1 MAG: indole-3-glycerol phosphate synthase TrpC [Rhodospirillales bacterium]
MNDILAKICDDKRRHIDRVRHRLDMSNLSPVRGFKAALLAARLPVIAEIKKASPSKGLLRADFDPARHARQYESAGAACLSVLTDEPWFQGTDDDLRAAREACALPVLRKDFMLDPWQVAEARTLGADCILVIMAALGDATAQALYDEARKYDMDVLIEVHDARERDRALALNAPDAMIGVNNRNLKTLKVALDTSFDLIRKIPADRIAISESGIASRAEMKSLTEAGFRGFLIGEALMTQPDPGQALLTF